MKSKFIEEKIYDFFNLHWLRPENVAWEVHAYKLISKYLTKNVEKIEVGIGNGITSFIYLGGRFKNSYDWYLNTNTRNFWRNEDIYNANKKIGISKFILKKPETKFSLVIDHKAKLLEQAKEMNISKNYKVMDANNYDLNNKTDLIFSNMLYWLNNPLKVISRIYKNLNDGGLLVLVFPNSRYLEYCKSYKLNNNFDRIINRGRKDSIKWMCSTEKFLTFVNNMTDFKVVDFSYYLSEKTMKYWDIGLRPISPYLIEAFDYMGSKRRLDIKQRWTSELLPAIIDFCKTELKEGKKNGCYNFFVLKK